MTAKVKQQQTHHDESSEIPSTFLCPLTLEVMKQPLYSKHGHTYERKAILEWLRENDTCPMTRRPLSPGLLIPNTKLAFQIQDWKSSNANNKTRKTKSKKETKEESSLPTTSLKEYLKNSPSGGCVSLGDEEEITRILSAAEDDILMAAPILA